MILVKTYTGSSYLIDNEALTVERVVIGPDSFELRRDGEVLRLQAPTHPVVGERMEMLLEPLGEGNATIRSTSPVVGINDYTPPPLTQRDIDEAYAWADRMIAHMEACEQDNN